MDELDFRFVMLISVMFSMNKNSDIEPFFLLAVMRTLDTNPFSLLATRAHTRTNVMSLLQFVND